MERRTFLSAAALLALKPSLSVEALTDPSHLAGLSDEDDRYWTNVRDMFPLDRSKIYLNNGTMGIMPSMVIAELMRSFKETADGNYPSHNEKLQKSIGDLIGAEAKDIAITKNVSEGTNHACWGIKLKKKDEVILTKHEHVGGAMPWLNRAKLDGIVIKTIDLGKTAEETLKNVEAAITKKTRVIAVPHIPCTIGQILPVKEICDLARSKNIVSCIDGAHPLGMIRFNVKDMGCDYYYGCVHKWALGPTGVGFFYVNPNTIEKTKISHIAAYSVNAFDMSVTPPTLGEYVAGAQRFSYGTFCGPIHDAAVKALDHYRTVGPEKIETRIRSLAAQLQEKIMAFDGRTEMVTPTEEKSRGAQIGFRIKNGKKDANQDFINKCREKKIILRYVGESGIDCIRVSTHYYNSEDEINTLVNELKNYIG